MTMKKDVLVTDYVYLAEDEFEKISQGDMKWASEASYAVQALNKNTTLANAARNNPSSLKYAMMNVAAIGLTLNHAERLAYLVPRDGVVCLDISYIGLAKLAVLDGGVVWIQAKSVRKNDNFKLRGFADEPIHEYDPFSKDRGEIIGVYSVARTVDGSFLTTTMTAQECFDIRNRTPMWKKFPNSGPWHTDTEQMMLKTVVKRQAKLLPKGSTQRLDKAIHVLNEHEGIDFEEEKKTKIISEESNLLNNALGKTAQIEAPPIAPDPEKDRVIESILDLCKKLCENYTPQQKLSFLTNEMKINSFKELPAKDMDFVLKLEDYLMGLLDSKENPVDDGEIVDASYTVEDIPWGEDDKNV